MCERAKMNIIEWNGLPFTNIVVEFRGKKVRLEKVLLDAGSASTLKVRKGHQPIALVGGF